jgi:hypothetical protein
MKPESEKNILSEKLKELSHGQYEEFGSSGYLLLFIGHSNNGERGYKEIHDVETCPCRKVK